jgi:hypothetical protein
MATSEVDVLCGPQPSAVDALFAWRPMRAVKPKGASRVSTEPLTTTWIPYSCLCMYADCDHMYDESSP